jgi:hypothetical protein
VQSMVLRRLALSNVRDSDIYPVSSLGNRTLIPRRECQGKCHTSLQEVYGQ